MLKLRYGCNTSSIVLYKCIFFRWDYIVDGATPNRGKQIYEKMISGMYVGELVRQILIDMVQRKLMFKVGIFSGHVLTYFEGEEYRRFAEKRFQD